MKQKKKVTAAETIDWKDPKQITAFKILVRTFYDYQGERIALDGRMGMKKDGKAKKRAPERDEAILVELYKRRDDLDKLLTGLEKEITRFVHTHPLWKSCLVHVKGCGALMAAVILSEIEIEKGLTVSNLSSYAGLAPGKDRKKKGKKCPYNQFLRSKLCGVLGPSFLQQQSMPYSMYYYNEKTRLENSLKMITERLRTKDRKKKEYKGMTERVVAWKDAYPDHRHKAAIRKMVKEFLKDLYVAWRTLEGLPVRKPYEEEYLNRKHAANE
jgi:hypothetical protein